MNRSPIRIAYADPPYIGQARKHYGPTAKEVNHEMLIAHLCEFDAWALSLSSPTLLQILSLCPADVRVGAWVKPFAVYKRGVDPAYAWEPVIYRTARKWNREQRTVRDWHSANITLKRGCAGAKPESFCLWLFDLLGAQPTDAFHDLFPGSGAVTQAWELFRQQRSAA